MQLLLPTFSALASATCAPTATIASGPIVGVASAILHAPPVNVFLGVPFGQASRFELAAAAAPWTKPLNATTYGPSCPQMMGGDEDPIGPSFNTTKALFQGSDATEAEACLNINVFAPADAPPPGGRAVLVFIPGGGFTGGNNIADLSGVAAFEDIVVMALNYRTNLFGFANHPGIPRNIGLHDQQLGLAWVQANAASFGGSPNKVTIWGESAGALSVDTQLKAYASSPKPPFRAAVMFSGQSSFGSMATSLSPNDTSVWNAVAASAGCNDTAKSVECMRSAPLASITKALDTVGGTFVPTADNGIVAYPPAKPWLIGNVTKVPILTGNTAEEGRFNVGPNATRARFDSIYLNEPLFNKTQRDAIWSHYKAKGLSSDYEIGAAIYTDFLWQCPQAMHARAAAAHGIPTWRYVFNESVLPLVPKQVAYVGGKFHGADLVLLFSRPAFDAPAMTPGLYAFANFFRGMLGRFVRNPEAGPGWPAVSEERYHGIDVAVLGGIGDGLTVVNQTELDAACGMYNDVLRSMAKNSL